MLLKRKSTTYIGLILLFAIFLFVACSKDDGNAPVDDTGTTDEEPIDEAPVDEGTGSTSLLGEIDWLKTYGGSNEDAAITILKTTDNNYVVIGSTRSTDGDLAQFSRPGNDSDFWILKISPVGNIIWSKVYGGLSDDITTSGATTSDGGYIISGHSRSSDGDVEGNAGFHDYWILKLNSAGNISWSKNFGFSGSDQAYDVIEKKNGGYLVTGFFDVSASGGEGNDGRSGNGTQHGVGEYWVINLDANGNYLWRRYFGGTNNDRSYSVIETAAGGVLVAGASESNDFDISNSKGSYDFWVVQLDTNGTKQWTKSFGGVEIDNGYDITTTEDGNYLFVGDTRSSDQDVTNLIGNADLWAVKLSPAGNLIWQKTFGGTQFDSARSVVSIGNGNYLISGASRSSDVDVTVNNGQNDAWAIIIDESGALLFEKAIGGSNFDFANDAILATDNTSIVMVGNTESNDKDISINRGLKDLLVVKIK